MKECVTVFSVPVCFDENVIHHNIVKETAKNQTGVSLPVKTVVIPIGSVHSSNVGTFAPAANTFLV